MLHRRARVRLAGHPPPLVLGRAPHTVAPPVGLPLGVRPNVRWQAAEVALEPGWALLLHTDWSVASIAACLGFEYPTYFSNFFKKHTGYTPLSLRRKA